MANPGETPKVFDEYVSKMMHGKLVEMQEKIENSQNLKCLFTTKIGLFLDQGKSLCILALKSDARLNPEFDTSFF